jgi:opacity protein-like surface antigen
LSGTKFSRIPSQCILTQIIFSVMKKLLVIPAILATVITTAITQSPQAAVAGGIGNNYIAPAVSFGGGNSVFKVDSKLGIADNVSLRPFVSFPSPGTAFGTSITYDWDLRQSQLPITPFLGVGVDFQTGNTNTSTTGFAQVGADFNVSDSIALLGSVAIPFNNNNNKATSVTLGAGLRF